MKVEPSARTGGGKVVDDSSPTVLSLFTGAGGLDLGLECAGFRTILCVEQDETARQTLKSNRPEWRISEHARVEHAAEHLAPAQLGVVPGELGAIVAGPPCQPFSAAAQWTRNGRRGDDDPRAASLSALVRLVEVFRPKLVVVENVPGFFAGKTAALPRLHDALTGAGNRRDAYEVHHKLLNAADFGVPQVRRRGFLVAVRGDVAFQWPEPTHAHNPVTAWDAIGSVRPASPPPATGHWADLLPSIPEGANYIWHTSKGGGRNLFGYRTRYWSFLLKLAKNRPSWTLPATPGPGTGPFHWNNRRLARSELLRLQSFPLGWKVAGDYRRQVQQIGNATPPLLAEALGRAAATQLWKRSFPHSPSLRFARAVEIPDPRPAADVPPKYLRHERAHAPHPGPGRGPRPVTAPATTVA